MLWDLIQQGQIGRATATAETAKFDARNNAERLQKEAIRLEAKLDRLAIVTQGLWELLSEKTNLTEDDIKARIAEIDIRDGRQDGKITGQPIACPQCGRTAHTQLHACPYCGSVLEVGHLVEKTKLK